MRMAVLTARCREPSLRSRASTCAGSGARKYLRRARYYAGDVISLMVGSCGAVLPSEEEHTDMHGKRFVWGRGCRARTNVEGLSTREYRTLRR